MHHIQPLIKIKAMYNLTTVTIMINMIPAAYIDKEVNQSVAKPPLTV